MFQALRGHPGALSQLAATGLAPFRQNRLTPWLYREVVNHGWEEFISPALLEELRRDYIGSLVLASRQQTELHQLVKGFSRAGLEVILLKGADLGNRLYGDPAVRPMDDFDLLFPREDLPRSQAALAEMGYYLRPECIDLCPNYWQMLGEALHFGPPSGGRSIVDLHWEIGAVVFYYRLPYAPLRQAAVPLSCHGEQVLVLSPEHLLIHLCLNALKDCDFPMLRLLDLALVLSRLPLDWPKVVTEAERLGCQRPVHLMLREAAHFEPLLVPPAVLAEMARYGPSFIEMVLLHGRLRYLTLALPSFYRHRSLRDWATVMGATLWPGADYLKATYGKHDRAAHFRRLLLGLFGEDQINPR